MRLFRKLSGTRVRSTDSTIFSRGPQAVHAEPGEEDSSFLREAGPVLGCDADEIDMEKSILASYGCDELEVIELIQIAEDVWGVSLMPSTFEAKDVERAVRQFATCGDIINTAKTKRTRQ